ncbi:MAG: hypothetical protein OES13_09640 [Acidimicrobiia bacterium]|nr:hypothetical protein [Acidimicrobiia bacterium]
MPRPSAVPSTGHQGTGDQYEAKGAGFRLNPLAGSLAIPGTLIITVAVLSNL